MRTIFLAFLITAIVVNGSILDTFLRWTGRPAAPGESTVDKTIDISAEALKEAKNLAYAGVMESFSKLSDFTSTAWETGYDAYSAAWLKYQEAKQKFYDWTTSSLQKSLETYTSAKGVLKAASSKLLDFANGYKNKAEDKFTDVYFEGRGKLETELDAASQAYDQAKSNLIGLYKDAYDSSIEDYQAAAQFYSDATDRLKKWTESKTKGANYDVIKTKLEDGRVKAKTYYKDTLSRTKDLKSKIDTFNKEVMESSQSNYDALKLRAEEAANDLKYYLANMKSKVGSKFEDIKSKLTIAQTTAANNLKRAETDLQLAKDLVEKYSIDALLSIQAKFQNLKDEL